MENHEGVSKVKKHYQSVTLFVILSVTKNPDPPDTRCFTPFNMTKRK
jgi:hypothetical protein